MFLIYLGELDKKKVVVFNLQYCVQMTLLEIIANIFLSIYYLPGTVLNILNVLFCLPSAAITCGRFALTFISEEAVLQRS